MNKKPNIIAIIPARGGSKGIPQKNVRLLVGKPLMAYTLETTLASDYIDKVVVSTDDELIAQIAHIYGAEVVDRPLELARDEVTLDPVIFQALKSVEQREGIKYDFVITIQPTSPLLSRGTLEKAIELMLKSDYDTLISVTAERHICWTKKNGDFVPLYQERQNRQQLEPIFRESGAIVISRRAAVTEQSRIGSKVHLYELPPEEGIDIDTYVDWGAVDNILRRLNIVFRVDGDVSIGLGHIYRALTLAGRTHNHNVFFLMDEAKKLGIRKVRELNFQPVTFKNEKEMFEILDRIKPDIIINDVLDTDEAYVLELKRKGMFVVNFEDMGEGADQADITINALYEHSYPEKNHFYGYRYECLAEQFYLYPPRKVQEKVNIILTTFGGVEQNNLMLKTLKAVEKAGLKDVRLLITLGLGYQFEKELREYLQRPSLKKNRIQIEVKKDVKAMAACIYNADIAVTSNGRTIYEVASLGVPCISISQNEREVRHLFSQICSGVMNLGMAVNVSVDDIASALTKIVDSYELRLRMSQKALEFDLKAGLDRVLNLIFRKYEESRSNQANISN